VRGEQLRGAWLGAWLAYGGIASATTGLATLEERLNQRLAHDSRDAEAALLQAVAIWQRGDSAAARRALEQLIATQPHFHLAHLIYGDLLQADVAAPLAVGEQAAGPPALALLRDEARYRLAATRLPAADNPLPAPLMMASSDTEHLILADKSRHRLFLYRWDRSLDQPILLRDYYMSSGRERGDKWREGDLRTPEGVYFITGHLPANRLPARYGNGAWPLNYPNERDRRLGKSGYGIWLHGVDPAWYSRPPLDSEGCLVLSNSDLDTLAPYLTPTTTPLVIADEVEWLDIAAWQAVRNSVTSAIESWRRDWQSGDIEGYLAWYDRDFWSDGAADLATWQAQKRRIARNKHYRQIEISQLALFGYPNPDGERLVVATFHQQYLSNNHNSSSNKRLYLIQRPEGWRILYEGRHPLANTN
jgi:murein L,D-transpeptidase YafK